MANILIFLERLDPRESIAQTYRYSKEHKYVLHIPQILRPTLKNWIKKKRLPLVEQMKKLLICFGLSWRSLFYDVVILREGTMAMFLSAFLMWRKRPKVIILHFNVLQRRNAVWLLVSRLLLRRVDCFIVHSKYDLDFVPELYKLPYNRFVFYPYIRVQPQLQVAEKEAPFTNDNKPYIMSYGIKARDYHTFFEAVRGAYLKVVVVTRKFIIEGLEIPNNVKVLFDIPLEECDRLVSNCLFTVFTFDGTEPSCGQISIITSLILGKPVICTDCTAVKDYIIDGYNGLLVNMRDAEDLRDKMLRLYGDRRLYESLSDGAKEWAIKNVVPEDFQVFMDKIVTELTTK